MSTGKNQPYLPHYFVKPHHASFAFSNPWSAFILVTDLGIGFCTLQQAGFFGGLSSGCVKLKDFAH